MAYTTIKKPSDYFNTVTYTGNTSAGHAITGVGFQPDLTWNKSRANATPHYLFDVIRGATNFIKSDSTSAESQNTDTLTSFDSDGFTLGNATGNNGSGSFASWNWLANGAGSSNTDGDITSTVSANTTSGFSIVSYTGNATSGATVGHGLGSTPKMIIFKDRSNVNGWHTYHSSFANATDLLLLDTTGALYTANYYINNTRPTSSVFSLGNGAGTNGSSENYIAYCFAEKQGYSKFGSYDGNSIGNDNNFQYCGFSPAFVMIKCSSAVESWVMFDSKRNGFNPDNDELYPNLSNAESSVESVDFLSNGFNPYKGTGTINRSGKSYIYMAFAEQPLVGDNPATAR